jgi:uncharacterized repeat protein (TIGR03803 family)
MKRYQPQFLWAGLLVVCAAVLFFADSAPALAQSEWIVHSFNGTAGDQPMGNLVADSSGNFYGTTFEGGTNSWGTVYELVRPVPPKTAWIENVLHSFTNGTDGSEPIAGLILDSAGNLYGTNIRGTSSRHGVVFELQAPSTPGGKWKEVVLHVFQPETGDGAMPIGELVGDAAGNLYGVTEYGGANQRLACFNSSQHMGCGSVFELSPPTTAGGTWTETILHSFNYGQGGWPEGGAILDAHGNLYGTTAGGGATGAGVVYRLSPPATEGGSWTYKVLHAFHPAIESSEGGRPRGALALHGRGILYGTTSEGGTYSGGTVFELTPPAVAGGAWTESILYSFSFNGGGTDGSIPAAAVNFDQAGSMYGTTTGGGEGGMGTVFKLTPPASPGGDWTESVLHSFGGTKDGATPSGGLILNKNGVLIGVTQSGGTNGEGTVYGVTK